MVRKKLVKKIVWEDLLQNDFILISTVECTIKVMFGLRDPSSLKSVTELVRDILRLSITLLYSFTFNFFMLLIKFLNSIVIICSTHQRLCEAVHRRANHRHSQQSHLANSYSIFFCGINTHRVSVNTA